jgi:penicillin-binding protein 2
LAPSVITTTGRFFAKGHQRLGAGYKFERAVAPARFWLLSLALVLVVLFFTARLFYLQLLSGERFQLVAQDIRTQVEWEVAPRGLIFDRNAERLVENSPHFSLLLFPSRLPRIPIERQEVILKAAKVSSLEVSKIYEKLRSAGSSSFQPVILIKDLAPEKALVLKTKLQELPAFRIQRSFVRVYKHPYAFSHLLGFLGDREKLQPQGKSGLEAFYNKELSGTPGRIELTVTALGLPQGKANYLSPQSGQDLVLNIDAELQIKLYEELEFQLEKLGAKKAAAVALDPKTGGILALVSLPSFDSNKISQGLSLKEFKSLLENPYQPFFDRAIAGQYPPGSIIKPVIAAGVLEEGIIDPKRQILVTGQIAVPSVFDPSISYVFKDWKAHGWTDLVKAIAVSSNVYFYTVGGGYGDIRGLGVSKLDFWMKKFGLGTILGIDLPGEAPGFVPSPEWKRARMNRAWYIGDTYNLSIGQGNLAVTPLQAALYTASIANGGTLFKPQILKSEPQILKKVVENPENLDLVRQGMRQAVTQGSARALNLVPVPVAGKTGTAQAGTANKPHGWFTGFAPYDNPEIVLTVLVENGGGGTTAAVPVAQRVLSWYFAENR